MGKRDSFQTAGPSNNVPNPQNVASTSQVERMADEQPRTLWRLLSFVWPSPTDTTKKSRKRDTGISQIASRAPTTPRTEEEEDNTPLQLLSSPLPQPIVSDSVASNTPVVSLRNTTSTLTQDPPAYPRQGAFHPTGNDQSNFEAIGAAKNCAYPSSELASPVRPPTRDLYPDLSFDDDRLQKFLVKIGAIKEGVIFTAEADLGDVVCERWLGIETLTQGDIQLHDGDEGMIQDVLELVISSPSSISEHIRKAHQHMLHFSQTYLKIPRKAYITGVCISFLVQDGGGEGNIYQGEYKGEMVAVKALRIFKRTSEKDRRTRMAAGFRQALTWRQLIHPNILPLYGVSDELDCGLSLVSPWMEHGNIQRYLESHKGVDILPLLLDVIEGVIYMHSLHLVHGDIKPQNILIQVINGKPRSLLCDFGLTSISSSRVIEASTMPTGGSVRFMAPELFVPSDDTMVPLSYSSDIFAVGMTICQLYDRDNPFHRSSIYLLAGRVKGGERPIRPVLENAGVQFSRLWDVMDACWRQDPRDRLPLVEIQKELASLDPIYSDPPSTTTALPAEQVRLPPGPGPPSTIDDVAGPRTLLQPNLDVKTFIRSQSQQEVEIACFSQV